MKKDHGHGNIVCFDIGGTSVKYALINDEGIQERGSFPTTRENGLEVLQQMSKVVNHFEDQGPVEGVSISSPGFVDPDEGTVISGNIIEGFNGLNLRRYFLEEHGLPLAIENDANAATIAEHLLGNGKGLRNLAVVTIGTGIGGGLILNDRLYTGHHKLAGEFGFMFINGIHTDQPETEILSNYASTRALVERASQAAGEPVDGPEVFARAEAGDAACQAALSDWYDALAMGIYNICYTIDPDAVLLGGAVSAQPALVDEVKKRISELTPSFSQDLNGLIRIDRAAYLNDAGLMGAYANFLQRFK